MAEVMRKSGLLFGLLLGLLVGLLEGWLGLFNPWAEAQMSQEALEKEHLARYSINYASYLIDVGKYLEALENYETAVEVTSLPKTKADALLAKATLLSSFLDAPEEALKVYQEVRKNYEQGAEIAAYREGLLLFDLERFDESEKILEDYLRLYPEGRFRFQAEALLEEIAKMPPPTPPAPPKPGPPPPIPPKPPAPVPPPPAVRAEHPQVRVRMCNTTGEAVIDGTKVCAGTMGCKDKFVLGVKEGRLLVNRSAAGDKFLVFESESPLTISCEKKKKRVRGRLVASIREGKLLVINVLDIEDYLLSVVPSENPAGAWPVESLKAQAVAARTYAYYQLLHRKDWAYDLVDFAGDQAYEGMGKEHPRSTEAVEATAGMVLTYEEKPILAMFSANSGGYTADAESIFNLSKPYLLSRQDPESLKGKMANWTRKFSVSEVVNALGRINIDAKGLKAIEAAERSVSGRIVKVRLVMNDGTSKVLRNRTTLRRALDLPEILHGIRREGDTFIFDGHGWGHGVGYSQWGSAYMGKEKRYEEILAFYYGGARLEKLW